jgi:hypothetical protein
MDSAPFEFFVLRKLDLTNGLLIPLSKSAQSCSACRVYRRREIMDHNESVQKFQHIILKQADHAQGTATELEAWVLLVPSEKFPQLARAQVKPSP